MTQSSKEEALKKWAPIIESMGVTGSKADWMSQYVEMHSINESNSQIQQPSVFDQTSNFPSILPVAKRIFAKTVGLDLVAVRPPGGNSTDDIDRIEKEVKSENRDRKIDAITDDKEFEEMKEERDNFLKVDAKYKKDISDFQKDFILTVQLFEKDKKVLNSQAL